MIIGAHVSFKSATQLLGSVKEALSYGANTFMIYTGTPQSTMRSKIDPLLTKEAILLMKDNNMNIKNIIVHAPYIINLANPNKMNFGISFLKKEIERTSLLGIKYIVLHPGNMVDVTKEEALDNIIFSLNEVLNNDLDVTICLETMAGKGSELGKSLEEIKYIIEKVNYKNKIGVCLDTCHLNDAGYDITNIDKFLLEFDNIIGLSYIKCIHLNDSKNERSSHKDRHANIGFGTIGFDNLIKIAYHDKLKDIPKILETPYIKDENNSYPPYREEIKSIIEKKFNKSMIKEKLTQNKNK